MQVGLKQSRMKHHNQDKISILPMPPIDTYKNDTQGKTFFSIGGKKITHILVK